MQKEKVHAVFLRYRPGHAERGCSRCMAPGSVFSGKKGRRYVEKNEISVYATDF